MKATRWAQQKPFNCQSPKQVLAYLQSKHYKIPKDRKTKQPTTNDDALDKILRNVKDPLLEKVLEVRGLGKALGYLHDTFIGADGKFHPIYTFRPETGRLSSVRPNMQNVPNNGVEQELAKAIRSCVVPSRPGRVLVECDWRAMEAVLTGYFAGDDDYIAASKKDSHTWLCGYILQDRGIISDVPSPKRDDFMDWAKDIKKRFKDERFLAKTINLATGYNMRWPLLASTLHCTAEEAKRFLAIKAAMAPKLEAWKDSTWREAHKLGYLTTPFGYINYFWDVLVADKAKPGSFNLGKEANAALAFRPQSSGAAMLREVMLDLEKYDGNEFDFLVPIHDAALTETDEKDAHTVGKLLASTMGRAWPELGGLVIEAEYKIGVNWGEMEGED